MRWFVLEEGKLSYYRDQGVCTFSIDILYVYLCFSFYCKSFYKEINKISCSKSYIKDSAPKGTIDLIGCKVTPCPTMERPYMFCITLSDGEKIYYLVATSDGEMHDWMDAIYVAGNNSIGVPYNVQHLTHVKFNKDTGYQGVPNEWSI